MKAQLALYFRRNGCIRVPNVKRQKKEGQYYKKGYEVRFTAFTKGNRFVQPVYGKVNLRRFRKLLRGS